MSIKKPLVLRRLEFIRLEAIHKEPRDQALTMIMRVISNYATLNKDVSSSKALRLNKNISEAAFNELVKSKTLNDWVKKVTNEHQMPLKETWKIFTDEKNRITIDYIWKHFEEYPMTTILKTENERLDALGYRDNGMPEERYKAAKIKLIKPLLKQSPEDWWRSNK
jgi:hypothetical protein